MPEGHSIHRYARLHRKSLGGQTVGVTSPQGRFSDGAARLDGNVVEKVDAIGKHLFYRWDHGATLHVHLGLFGRFRTFRQEIPPPTRGTRLAMETPDATVYLAGPTICNLITPEEEEDLRSRLGPDPLDRKADPNDFAARLSKRRIPISGALLDQKVIAGIGNVYRAELLFLAGVSPHKPANELTGDEVEQLWTLAVSQLRAGEKSGRIVTVAPNDVGATKRSEIPRRESLFVYKRDGTPCRTCGTNVRIGESANRKVWWCPSCQAA